MKAYIPVFISCDVKFIKSPIERFGEVDVVIVCRYPIDDDVAE